MQSEDKKCKKCGLKGFSHASETQCCKDTIEFFTKLNESPMVKGGMK